MSGPDALRAWLVDRVARALGVSPGSVDTGEALHDLGLSSRELTGVAGDLARHLDRTLAPELIWQHPTIDALATALAAGAAGAAEKTADGTAPRPAGGPVAVVGIGCRLPGGIDSPAAFRAFLAAGGDAIGTVPADRWEAFASADELADVPRHGGFLDDALDFDAAFFGITPREAVSMDPQQRVLLEVAWAALEHAGIAPGSLRGTRTGVFVGVSAGEYGRLTMQDVRTIEPWAGTGASIGLTANRVSYVLDLRGPSVTVDTACSSSLVAMHQAVVALQRGECDTALVGGVNLQLSGSITAAFDRLGALSPDGRCKPFAAGADGIGRGEGCGVVVLKPLTAARRDRDRVLAVVRGSAVNSDGRSNGITAPNPAAQRAVLREACAAAGLQPTSLDYVEAHGTGTPLGDPIEAAALGGVLGAGRDADRPLLIGSVKSNIGHLEGAAGIAGFIKVVLAMADGRLPATLHHDAPHPGIDFDGLRLRVVTEAVAWPRYSGTARAGVSAFGFGGTNAHVVVEEWPGAAPVPASTERRLRLFALSATSRGNLRARGGDLAAWLDSPEGRAADLDAVAATLAMRREHLPVRSVAIASDRSALIGALTGVADGGSVDGTAHGSPDGSTDVVFVFSGYGSQWDGMGGELLATEPAFRTEVEALDPVFRSVAGFSLHEAITSGSPLPDLAANQLVLMGIQLAQAALWRAHGVRPTAVVGHSMGEVAAAVVAGALDVADAVRVMSTRARLLTGIDTTGAGAMAVLELSAPELDELADRVPGVGIAVYGAPGQCTVSGAAEQVAKLAEHVEGLGRLARILDVGTAGHSPAIDPLLAPLRVGLAGLPSRPPGVPCYSTVFDDPRAPSRFDVDHWVANLRRPVRLHQALAAAMEDGRTVFVELSPHPVALSSIERTAEGAGVAVTALATAHRKAGEQRTFLTTLARLHVAGVPHVLDARTPRPGAPVELPAPRWDHQRYWPAPPRRPAVAGRHPLLGAHVELPETPDNPGPRHAWQGDVGTTAHPWLADHTVLGVAVLPGTAYVELALAAARTAVGRDARLRDVELLAVLPVQGDTAVTTMLTRPGLGPDARVAVHARSLRGGWTCHATARVTDGPAAAPVPIGPAPDGTPLDLYAALEASGQLYGPTFRGLTSVVTGTGRASASVRLPAAATDDPAILLHPALSDACLQALAAASGLLGTASGPLGTASGTWVPAGIGAVTVLGDPRNGVRVDALLAGPADDVAGLTGTVQLVDAGGTVLVELADVHARRLGRAALPVPVADVLLGTSWVRAEPPRPARGTRRSWLWLDAGGADIDAGGIDAAGATVVTLPFGDGDGRLARLRDGRPTDVVVLAGPSGSPGPDAAQPLVLGIGDLVRELTGLTGRPPRLWLVTRGAQVVAPGEYGDPGPAALRALVRVLAFEHPELHATLVDLEPDPDRAAPALLAELLAGGDLDRDTDGDLDDEIAWRDGARLVRRLARPALDAVPDPPAVREGAYLISGGLGGLGLAAAGWLADRGATRLVLSGRRGATPEVEPALAALRGRGVEVEVVAGDIAEPGTAERLVAVATRGGVALRGVLHAAGVLADGATAALSADALTAAWRPKALGAWRLHEATRNLRLDWWLVHSSAAALLGSPGQAAYATANAWADALVEHRRAAGLPATTIQWGAWGEIGRAAGSTNPVLEPLATDLAFEALDLLLRSGRASTGVARVDAATVLALFPAIARRPFLGLLTDPVLDRASVDHPGTGWPGMAVVRARGPVAAATAVTDHLAAVVAALMGADDIDRSTPLVELGLDSLLAVRARTAVERDFGLTLPMPLLLRGANLAEVADALVDQAGLAPVPAAPADHAPRAVGPRDPAERWVARRWADVLAAGAPDVHQDFADAGGDPAAAADLTSQVVAELGAEVASRLFDTPTIAGMADVLRARIEGRSDDGRTAPTLRTLRVGRGSPLFLFHPAGGPTSVYQELVHRLGGDHHVYGLERFTDVASVQERARRYAELVRETRPGGPYHLAGWSFGGCLAYETARLLQAAGDEVSTVTMIDTILPLPAPDRDPDDLLRERFGRFAEHIQQTYGVTVEVPAGEVSGLDDEAQIDLVIDQLVAHVPGMGRGVLHHQRTSYLDARAAERYRPGRRGGRTVLLRADDSHMLTTELDPRYRRADATLGWDEHCPQIEVVHVTGDHLSMIDPPHVDGLAAALDAVLDPPVESR